MRENSKIDVEKNKEDALMALANAVSILQKRVHDLEIQFEMDRIKLEELINAYNENMYGDRTV